MDALIAGTAGRIFAEHSQAALAALPVRVGDGAASAPPALWRALDEAGFPLALLTEAEGGFGLDPADAFALLRLCAAQAAPVPLAETMMANRLLASAGLELAEGPGTFCAGPDLRLKREGGAWRLTGRAARIAWARDAQAIAVLVHDPDGVARLARVGGGWTVEPGHNLAAEPRDALGFDLALADDEVAASPVTPEDARVLGALLRVQSMAGAAQSVLGMCVDYANTREQFGRPIGRFQANQQSLAVMAGQVAATVAGADMAVAAYAGSGIGPELHLAVAAAKLRAGEAAGMIAAAAHQLHGAIGFTREFVLHPLTRRLWAWRDEYGAEAEWAEDLGREVARLGADAFWPFLTRSPVEARA